MYTLRKLSDEEKKSPLASLLDIPITVPELSGFTETLEEKECYYPQTPNDIINSTKREPNGWAVLENGVGYITVGQNMPGVTVEMLEWMFAWQGLSPLNYAVLNPDTHHSAAVSDVDREKLMNPYLPIDVKCQGITLLTVEDTPVGLQDNITLYSSPEDLGITKQIPETVLIGGSFIRQNRTEMNPGKKWMGIIMHQITPEENGVSVLIRIWVGCRILRKEIKRLDNVSIQPTPEFTQMLARQTAQDWAKLSKSLPAVYEITKGKLE